MDDLNKIGFDIIGAAYEVKSICGKHLLESFYENAMAYELRKLGHKVEQQKDCQPFIKVWKLKMRI